MPTIGYWIKSLDDDQFLAPQEVAGKLTPDIVEQVVAYLRRGKLYTQYRGLSWCRFRHRCAEAFMGSSELTDGYWIWPEGLVHYVEVHRVALPEEFLGDALNKLVTRNKSIELDPDIGFWVNWCSQNQDPVFRKQLIGVRQTPRQEAQDALIAEINALQLKYGFSEQLCLSEGCRERALQSQVVCVKHFLGDERWERGWRSVFDSLLYDFGQEIPQKT